MSASVKWAKAGTSVIAIVVRLSFALVCQGCRGCSPANTPGSAAQCWPSRGVHRGRSVVVAAATDGVSGPSHQHQCQADDEEDDPDDQAKMGVGEGRKEGREKEPENDEEDSEADHDVYLVSSGYGGGGWPGQCSRTSFSSVLKRFGVAQPDRRVFAQPGSEGDMLA